MYANMPEHSGVPWEGWGGDYNSVIRKQLLFLNVPKPTTARIDHGYSLSARVQQLIHSSPGAKTLWLTRAQCAMNSELGCFGAPIS